MYRQQHCVVEVAEVVFCVCGVVVEVKYAENTVEIENGCDYGGFYLIFLFSGRDFVIEKKLPFFDIVCNLIF